MESKWRMNVADFGLTGAGFKYAARSLVPLPLGNDVVLMIEGPVGFNQVLTSKAPIYGDSDDPAISFWYYTGENFPFGIPVEPD